jgi:hypothetical protein
MMQSVFQPYKWDDGSLIQAEGDPAVYVMDEGKRRLIPDPATLQHHWSWDVVQTVSPAEVIAIARGDDWPRYDPGGADPALYRFTTPDQHLGANHWMQTSGRLVRASGEVAGTTRTRTLTWFGGFHGAVSVILTDQNDDPVPHSRLLERYGVDGTKIGTSDRTDPWVFHMDPTDAQRVRRALVFHTWAPDDLQVILDKWVQTGQKAAQLVQDAGRIAAVFAA